VLYNRTAGRRVLEVSGDEAGDALVFAHCAKNAGGGGGGDALAGADGRAAARLAFVVFTPLGGNLSTNTPVLNGNGWRADVSAAAAACRGWAPAAHAGGTRLTAYCSEGVEGAAGAAEGAHVRCAEAITLPPRSWAFFVLLGARADAACGEGI
jgi:hypothetical protein